MEPDRARLNALKAQARKLTIEERKQWLIDVQALHGLKSETALYVSVALEEVRKEETK